MSTKTITFEPGKVYCVDINNIHNKRLVLYQGPEHPWQDICSGEETAIDTATIQEALEVPRTVVDVILFCQDKRPLPISLPHNEYNEDVEPWERDVYWDV